MINFEQIFPEIINDLEKYKVHMAMGRINKKDPLYTLVKNQFKEWQEYQNNKNFEREYIFSLVHYKTDQWIFGGIYKRIGVKKTYDQDRKKDYYQYKTELLNIQTDLIGRLVINFKKDFRQSYILLEKHYENFKLGLILEKPYKIESFPGYENVLLDFKLLQEIIYEEESTWKSALSNTKGVYLITDKTNGKNYIGSAYGENAFWDRWRSYAKNGHGGNVELKEVIEMNGMDYADNFQFAIVEVRSSIIDDELIIRREAHWKNILKSREFGYNKN